jgi:hypothetical protein
MALSYEPPVLPTEGCAPILCSFSDYASGKVDEGLAVQAAGRGWFDGAVEETVVRHGAFACGFQSIGAMRVAKAQDPLRGAWPLSDPIGE